MRGRVDELELATRRQLVLTLVATIKAVNAQIKELERHIAAAIGAHPGGAIFTSLFKQRNSVICAAELLAEIGDCRGGTRQLLARGAPLARASCPLSLLAQTFVARRPDGGTVEMWTLTAPACWASRVGVQDRKRFGASAAACRRLAGALQKQRSSR